jgi:drug/metabolite transporter (DMT)-like permease
VKHPLGYLIISVLLFGGVWPVSKDALHDATPLWFALNRAGMAAVVSGLMLAALGRLRLPKRADMSAVLALGLLQLGGFFALMHTALGILPAGRSSILGNVTLFWLIPLSVWLLGERVSARRWAAAGLGLVGVTVLMAPWEWAAAGSGSVVLGYAMLLCCSLMWSLAIIVTRRFPPASSVLELLPWCFGLAALLVAPIAFWREPQGGIGMGALWQAIFVGGVAGPIGTWSTIEAGRRLPGAVVSLGFLMVPAIGVVVSSLWLGETLGWDVLLGGGLIAVSVVVAVKG